MARAMYSSVMGWMVSLTTILRISAEDTELRIKAVTRPRRSREIMVLFIAPNRFQQYSYSYLWFTIDISSESLVLGSPDGGPLQPGRLVLPVMSRAPRSYAKYDSAHWMRTSTRL